MISSRSIGWKEALGKSSCWSLPCTSFNACPEPTIFSIPIIDGQVDIQGPQIICEGATETYRLPPFSGTSFEWEASPGAAIRAGQQTNEVLIDWGNAITGPQLAEGAL